MLVELDVVTLDFETYFDSDYTLSKMTTEEYIRDSRFEVHGLGVRFPCGKKVFYENPNEFLDKLPGFTVFLCHHAQFDGLILNHHFNVRPSIWFDTYSMAKYLFDASQPKGLGALAKHYCLPDKSVPYETVKGKQWKDLPLEDQIELSEGCKHDCELTYQIFIKMMQTFPESELKLIDLTIRMFTEPRLQGNVELLKSIAHNERETKNEKLIALGVSETQLASADQFTLLLKDAEVSIAYKQGKNKPSPAVAKSDGFMQDLLNSDDAYIADLAAARIAVKSTL
ncbi:MAG: hypothetical protein KGI08_07010, partial [Thaumarchaeota archaeon]|nr:hypothetical protein [Nitrososphaerota archaeon]